MILRNNAHPKGIDMGPAERVAHGGSSIQADAVRGKLGSSGPEPIPVIPDRCPICNVRISPHGNQRSCIKPGPLEAQGFKAAHVFRY